MCDGRNEPHKRLSHWRSHTEVKALLARAVHLSHETPRNRALRAQSWSVTGPKCFTRMDTTQRSPPHDVDQSAIKGHQHPDRLSMESSTWPPLLEDVRNGSHWLRNPVSGWIMLQGLIIYQNFPHYKLSDIDLNVSNIIVLKYMQFHSYSSKT